MAQDNYAGIGTFSCKELVKEIRSEGEVIEKLMGQWMIGYLSALNLVYLQEDNLESSVDLGNPGSESLQYSLVRHCELNPDDTVMTATWLMWIELRRMQGLEPDARFLSDDSEN